LKAASRGRFVGGAVDAVHFVIGELNDHLNERVRGTLEFLYHAFAVALIGLDFEVVLRDNGIEVGGSAVNCLGDVGVEVEFEGKRFGKIRPDGWVAEIELVSEDKHICVIVEAMGWSAVHHAVFAYKAGGTIVVDDELERLVEPAVHAITMPVLVSAFFKGDR